MKKTVKDRFSDYARVGLIVSGAILGMATSGVQIPKWLNLSAIVIATVSGALVAHLTGKGDDGRAKKNTYRI